MIAIIGPGAVGGLVAALLCRSGSDTAVLARPETAKLVEREGLTVRSSTFGDFSARPRTLTELDVKDAILLVTTKAADLEAAIKRVHATPALVLPLLNGLEHMPVLRARFGAQVLAGSITVESHRPEAGVILHTSRAPRVHIATPVPSQHVVVRALSVRFAAAGIDVVVSGSESLVLWSKLVRLNALACTTSASGLLLGAILDDRAWRGRLEQAVAEAAEVARAEGAPVDASQALADLMGSDSTQGSSMARDIAAGREPELDAIAGAVLRAARRNDISVPTIAWLAAEAARRAEAAPLQY